MRAWPAELSLGKAVNRRATNGAGLVFNRRGDAPGCPAPAWSRSSAGAAAADDESARPEFDECFISGSTTISWAEYVRLSTDYEATRTTVS